MGNWPGELIINVHVEPKRILFKIYRKLVWEALRGTLSKYLRNWPEVPPWTIPT